MDFWDVIKKRRSVRNFSDKDVSKEDVEKILKVAHLAPSGSNAKNWRFIVVRDKKKKQQLTKDVEERIDELAGLMSSKRAKDDFLAYSKYFTFFEKAPVVIAVVMAKYDSLSTRIINRYDKDNPVTSTAGVQNVAASVENMLLACTGLGLGACWMTGPLIAKNSLEKSLGIGGEDELFALVPVGWPETEPKEHEMPEDVDIDDIVTWM